MCYSRPRGYRKFPSANEQMKELTALRAELPWLADVPRHASAQLLKDLDDAWQQCFNGTSQQPKWKNKGKSVVSFTETEAKKCWLKNNKLNFPKLGNLRVIIHRPLEGKPKIWTISCEADQWFINVVCEISILTVAPKTTPVVALDRGVINAVADSDGRIVESPHFYTKAMKRLARAQRNVARKVKGSKNQDKAKKRVARLHQKIRRQRAHFIHGLSSYYVKNHGTVVIEKLKIDNMVKANRGLSRSILDSGWGMLAEQLRYKMLWSGGQVIEVPAHYSSQTCSVCGHVDADNRSSQSVFKCLKCGHVDHADLNAAKVLLSRANRSGTACRGSSVGSPMKQEIAFTKK